MREILFRGKRKDDGEWIKGFAINTQYDIKGEKHIYIGALTKSDMYPLMHTIAWYEVIPETVGQYTGRNIGDEEIFKGDILENDTSMYIVYWDEEYLSWGVKNKKGNGCYNLRTLLSDKKRPCKKIGNIHDNPELIEEGGKQC